MLTVWITLVSCSLFSAGLAVPPTFDHGVDIGTTRPLVVAHRGFSGAYPDHSSIAYEEAIRHGADVIECDICLTQDLRLVCLHEAWLKSTTDVEDHEEFADRQKTQIVDGSPVTNNWFTPDFTLAELKQLRMKQRLSYRDPAYNGQYQIVTLEEYLDIVSNAGRTVGIYPEVKNPDWVNSLQIITDSGKRFEDLILEKLAEYGYASARDPCFVQTFTESSLLYMANKTSLPLIMLVSSGVSSITDEMLTRWAQISYGIGPAKRSIVYSYSSVNGDKNWISDVTDLVERAHAKNLKVHPYTFRNEDRYLAWDYMQDPWFEYDKFFELGVDGYFTDFTPTLVNFLDDKYRVCEPQQTTTTDPQKTTTTDPATGGTSSPLVSCYLLFFLCAAKLWP